MSRISPILLTINIKFSMHTNSLVFNELTYIENLLLKVSGFSDTKKLLEAHYEKSNSWSR